MVELGSPWGADRGAHWSHRAGARDRSVHWTTNRRRRPPARTECHWGTETRPDVHQCRNSANLSILTVRAVHIVGDVKATHPGIWFPCPRRSPDRTVRRSRSSYRVWPRVWDSLRRVDLKDYLVIAISADQNKQTILFVSNQFHFIWRFLLKRKCSCNRTPNQQKSFLLLSPALNCWAVQKMSNARTHPASRKKKTRVVWLA